MTAQDAIRMIQQHTAQALTRIDIERCAYRECHSDYIGIVDGRPSMLYLNPSTGETELWPVSQIPTEYLLRIIR